MTANPWERLRLAASCILQSYDAEQPDLAWHVKMHELRDALAGLMQLADLPAAAPEPVADNRYRDLILWALGEGDSDFPPRHYGDGGYYWRNELRRRLKAIDNAPKPAEPAPPASDWRERFLVYLARCEDGIDRDGPKMVKALFDGLVALEADVARLAKKVGG